MTARLTFAWMTLGLLGFVYAFCTGAAGASRLELTSAVCPVGQTADLYLLVSNDEPLLALEASIFLPAGLRFVAVDQEGCPDACGLAVFEVTRRDSCVAVGIVTGLEAGPEALPPAQRRRLARLRVILDAAPGEGWSVDLRDGCGAIGNILVLGGEAGRVAKVTPESVGGSVGEGPLPAPAAPPGPRIEPEVCSDSAVEVGWDDDPQAGAHEVWLLLEGSACWSLAVEGRGSSASLSALPPGTHQVRLRAGNAAGWSAFGPVAAVVSRPCPFVRGDANGDLEIDIADPVRSLLWLFAGAAEPPCLRAADADGGGAVELTDVIYLLAYLFKGGPPPLPPYPGCGVDSGREASIDCRTPSRCP